MRGDRVVYNKGRCVVELLSGHDDRHTLIAYDAKALLEALSLDNAFDAVLDRKAFQHLFNAILSLGFFVLARVIQIKSLSRFVEHLILCALAFDPFGGEKALLTAGKR